MKNNNADNAALLIERLKEFEYEIRRSIVVREDQEDNADPQHISEAERCGLPVGDMSTKGDLLNAVQTAIRSAQATAGKS